MGKVLVNDSSLTNIANSIRTKLDVETTYKPSQMSAAIDSIETGGNLDIHGIIKEYTVAAGENVSAGDFVSFVNSVGGTDYRISTKNYSGDRIAAVALSDNRVFIAYSSDSVNYTLNCIVCTIFGLTVIEGYDVNISNENYAGGRISVIALSDNKVFISHTIGSKFWLNGVVCTISETSIFVGSDTVISTRDYSGSRSSVVALSEDKVFIAHSSPDYHYLNGVVCAISGTTITVGTDTSLSTTRYTGDTLCAVKLGDTTVFIAHTSGENGYLNGIVCTVSDMNITKGTDTRISTAYVGRTFIEYPGSRLSMAALSENKVFIAYASESYDYLNCVVCTISGSTITSGTNTRLLSTKYSGDTISVTAFNQNEVLILHSSDNTDYYLNAMPCYVTETGITPGTDATLLSLNYSANKISAVTLNENKVFVAHSIDSTNRYLNGTLWQKTIQKASANLDILGIANSDGQGDEVVQVYVPS